MASSMSRTLSDADGRVWIVTEMRLPIHDHSGRASLVFSTDDAVRRVRTFPREWFELLDDDLLALSRGR